MTIISVSIHAKLHTGIKTIDQLTRQLADDRMYALTDEQKGDIKAMITGVKQFKERMQDFPDFSTQTPQQLTVLRHDLRNHLNLISGFAFVFVKGLGGDLEPEQVKIAQQIHQLSKGLISIVNTIA